MDAKQLKELEKLYKDMRKGVFGSGASFSSAMSRHAAEKKAIEIIIRHFKINEVHEMEPRITQLRDDIVSSLINMAEETIYRRECDEDRNCNVRKIDEIINGKEGMAKQASLIDLIDQIEEVVKKAKWALEAKKALEKHGKHLDQCGIMRMVCPKKLNTKYKCCCGLDEILSTFPEGGE